MGTYAAPYGLATRPFSSGGSFPGAPGFSTPTPAGGLGALGFPVTNGPPSFQGGINGFSSAVQTGNRVSEWNTNGQNAYHYVVASNRNDDNSSKRIQSLGIGMLCFSRDMRNENFTGKVPKYGPGAVGERTVEVFELTDLNVYLGKLDGEMKLETARQVIDAFPMLGVVLTEVAPSNDTDWQRRAATRVINFVVRGRCQMFNLWSGARPAGSPLYLLVKKRLVDNNKWKWCFEPYPCKEDDEPHPSPRELCWMEPNPANPTGPPIVKVGEAIQVGTLGHNLGDVSMDPNVEMWRQGLFRVDPKMMPPTSEVFLRV